MKKVVALSVVVIFLSSQAAFSHGIEIELLLNYPAAISTSIYSADEPAKGIRITVYSPADKTKPYQIGETDPAGKFAFIPNAEGTWLLVADDGHGHKEESEVIINADFFHPQQEESQTLPVPEHVVEPAESTVQEMPKSYKILMGLSLLFGITGIYYGLKVKQSIK